MEIQHLYVLFDIMRETEVALCVEASDYDERDCDVIIANVKKRLSRQFQIDFNTYKANDKELELSQYKNNLYLFIETVTRLHGILSGYCQIARYNMNTEVSLSSINYMGVSCESMQRVLKCLEYKDTYSRARESLVAIKVKLATISICTEKRLFLLLIIADELGLYELSSCLAEILYLGTL